MSNTLELFDPRAWTDEKKSQAAPRRLSLQGIRIGILDNGKHQGSLLLEIIAMRMVQDYGARVTARVRKRIQAEAASSQMLAEMAGCDAVLTAIGD